MKNLLKITFTLLFTTTILLGFAMPLNPVGNWYQQFLPNLNEEPISDIFFIDSLTGWATTGDGLPNDSNYILKTTNGGNNWQIKFTAYRDFFRVRFINQNTGFVCGGLNNIGQVLYKSTNGGENWYPINAPSVIRILDMSVLNEDTLWLAESDAVEGGVYRTTNGGTNWELQYQGNSPNRIYMFNRNLGFISPPTAGTLYRTTNSGQNWVHVTGTDGFSDICFVDVLTGWKASGFMRKSTNGGLNWVQQLMPSGGIITNNSIRDLHVLNKDTIIGVGGTVQYPNLQSRGIIYRTINGGGNWQFQVPDTSAVHLFDYRYIQFINSFIGWAYRFEGGIHTTVGGDTEWITPVTQISTEVPKVYMLYQNYPNPFNPVTNIGFRIAGFGLVTLKIFDITGREVQKLLSEELSAGEYEIDFDAESFSSGVYFYTLISGNNRETKKMLLLK